MTVLSARLSVHVQKMDTPDEEELQNDLESQDYNANETPHETLTFAPNLAALMSSRAHSIVSKRPTFVGFM